MAQAQSQSHAGLWVAGLGVAGLAAYEFIFRPWQAAQAAAATAGGGSALAPLFPSSMISSPTLVGPSVNPGGVQGSIVDPRVSPGGDVGQAMWRKNWTQAYTTARLAAMKKGYADSLTAIAQLQNQVVNPLSAGIPAAQLQAQLNDKAAADEITAQQAALAAGDTVGAALHASAAAVHEQDAREIRARIATASAPPDNTAAIAAYQGTIAGLKADYMALTGMTLG